MVVKAQSEWAGSGFWNTITNSADRGGASRSPSRRRSLVTVLNVVMGTLIAWVLVRDRLLGKRALEVVIDIPFALPTIVAGLVLLSLYGPKQPDRRATWPTPERAVFLALAVRDRCPFVVRTVQPVLEELDPEVEEAAASLGRQPVHHLPAHRAAQPGAGHRRRCRAVVRPAISEYGSLVLLSGNLPIRTEVASVRILTLHRERQHRRRGRGRHRPAGRLARGDRAGRRHPATVGPPWLT